MQALRLIAAFGQTVTDVLVDLLSRIEGETVEDVPRHEAYLDYPEITSSLYTPLRPMSHGRILVRLEYRTVFRFLGGSWRASNGLLHSLRGEVSRVSRFVEAWTTSESTDISDAAWSIRVSETLFSNRSMSPESR